MKYKILIYGLFSFLACQETPSYNYELRTWRWTGFDTLLKIDTIKLISNKVRMSNEFDGYYDAGVNFKKQYRIDSLIASHIHLFKKGDTLINNQQLHIELLNSRSFEFQNKQIAVYRFYIDYAPFSPIGGPVVLFTEDFGVIHIGHSHGKYTLNLNTIHKVNDNRKKKVNLEDFMDRVTNDTILFPLPPVIQEPEIIEIPDVLELEKKP